MIENIDAYMTSFGQAVTVNNVSITAIFDNEYAGFSGLGVGIDSNEPILTCKSADVSTAVQGTAAVVGGVTYAVVGVEPDGTGITTLRLEQQ